MKDCTELIIKARQGDTPAFARLVDLNRDYVYRLAFRLLMDTEQAKDVAQETFIRVWKQLHRFQPGKRFSTWIYKITVNLCYDRLRARQRFHRLFERSDSTDVHIASQVDMEADLIDRERLETVQKFVNSLSPKQRMVFVLRDLEDQDIAEIAALLGISTGAVKTHLYLARKTIREQFQQD